MGTPLHITMFEQYFTDSEHRFMTAVTETLIAGRWEDDEAFAVAPDVLTDWEYAEDNIEVKPFVSNSKPIRVSKQEISESSISTDNSLFFVNVLVRGAWYELTQNFTSEMEAKKQVT